MTARTISIFGATGSVGRSTIDLVAREPERWSVDVLTANRDVRSLAAEARRLGARMAVVADDNAYADLKDALAGSGIAAAAGVQALSDAADVPSDIVMAAIVGAAGLPPTLRAVERGARVAFANKETLVCAGELVNARAKRSGAHLLPVDSEHNAIHQVFDFENPERVSRIILTASGGPFRTRSLPEMAAVTPSEAVAHPVWSMGAKISVDSATLMNKGLELIEAYHLFPVEERQLDVIVHPQSVVHSFVEYVDGSMLAQLGSPDMRIPIAYALSWPDRMATPCARLDLAQVARLDFEAPDPARFPALRLAREALVIGGSSPTVLNAANEVAVAAFLEGRIGFLDIAAIVEQTMEAVGGHAVESLDDVLACDSEARRVGETHIRGRAH
ncbi:1-deoxy-D-xylulose-5-phosphate reductoisomerase [Sphingosinicella xenopeptidilytica]|uniref:1-deoxy-D-xylulose 5-phosphate reductoisomerase n=1 Tax=Sphingosinicella xenopeptidilytica TaxID=364098 RepID=A0ABW3C7R5_SPHXN